MPARSTFQTKIPWNNEIHSLDKDDIIFCLYIEKRKVSYGTEFVWAVLSKNGNYRGIKKSYTIPTQVRILTLTNVHPTQSEIIPLFSDPIESIMAIKSLIRRIDVTELTTNNAEGNSIHD